MFFHFYIPLMCKPAGRSTWYFKLMTFVFEGSTSSFHSISWLFRFNVALPAVISCASEDELFFGILMSGSWSVTYNRQTENSWIKKVFTESRQLLFTISIERQSWSQNSQSKRVWCVMSLFFVSIFMDFQKVKGVSFLSILWS